MLVILKKIIHISLILIAVFSFSNTVFAQVSDSSSLSSINLSISPNSPRAGDSVVLTVSSETLNIDAARITWYIDGIARKDTSNKSVTIKAKNSGQKTLVRVVIETSDGIIKETSREISPVGLDLIIEPTSYISPFYKGKPFFVSQGTVRILAIPDVVVDGVKIASKNLNFKWIRGGTILGSFSGKGKDSIIITGVMPIRDIDIEVEISDSLGNVLTSNSKIINVDNPKILFYENSPLYGILYNKSIVGSYYLGTREELKIVAKPFSFDFSNDIPIESRYVWYSNGNYVAPTGAINEILLRQTGTNLKGTATISLDVKNSKKILQFAGNKFDVVFGQ